MTIDYLSLTVFTSVSDLAIKALTHLFGYELAEDDQWSDYFHNRNIAARGYAALFAGPENATLYGYPRDGHHTHLELKGKTLEVIQYDNLSRFIECLQASGLKWKATRVDIAFDDVPFTPAMCNEAYDLGCYRTKANRNSGEWHSNKQGATFYLGSRSSGRFLRIYDRRGPTRCEIQFKDPYAMAVATNLPDIDQVKQVSLGYLRDFVEFTLLPVEGKNSSRIPISIWWETLVGSADKISLNPSKNAETFVYERTVRHFERMVPTLCIFRYGLEIDIDAQVTAYYPKLSSMHQAKIKRLQQLKVRDL